MYVRKMAVDIRISVRSLVEFLLRSGDLDNRIIRAPEEAMLEGSRMHRRLQKAAGPDYEAEVPLRFSYVFPEDEFLVTVEGRADGIYLGTLPDEPEAEKSVFVDEIKTTYRNLAKMTAPEPVHLAQARCYAYIYAEQHSLPFIYIRMTYVNLDTEDIHYFYERLSIQQLTDWFDSLMKEYHRWAAFSLEWGRIRTDSIHALEFPFPYRDGQKELAAGVYRTIVHGRKLFLEAPTGTGKTISTLFPSIKAMGEGKAEKIFYLTAKTITRAVAEDTLALLRTKGLSFKSVTLTAKEKICVLGKPQCDPDSCPRAAGHYDRINEAIYDLLTHEEYYGRTVIEEYAEKYQVCPFEMSLDMSLFADAVICDYNYVFDPHAYLRRFFADGMTKLKSIFLVDEAHNLVDRGRDMYSSAVSDSLFLSAAKAMNVRYPDLAEKSERCAGKLHRLEIACGTDRERVIDLNDPDYLSFLDAAAILFASLNDHFENERRKARRRKRKPSVQTRELQEKILNFYFELSHFELILELLDEHYRVYTDHYDRSFRLHLFCMDPGTNLGLCMSRAVSTILFSATLLPIQYYKQLLGGTKEDYELYAHSIFDPERRALLIADDVTSRYARRGEEEYRKIAGAIRGAIAGKHGNYLVFFPSYSFLGDVEKIYRKEFLDRSTVEVISQNAGMTEEERDRFLKRFATSSDEHSLLGFCVLGGVFSEGIDLKEDSLIGVVIVGTGVPQVGSERELLKNYFDETGVNGYDYAYRYPGMNKVLQAAGRVIRTEQDTGIVALLDERFLTPAYRRLFPREWTEYRAADSNQLGKLADRFWDEWL